MTTSWARSRAWSLVSTRLTWVLAVAMLTKSSSAISAFERPLPARASTSRSRSVSTASAASSTARVRSSRGEVGHQLAGDAGGEQGLAVGDHPDGGQELGGLGVLEEE